MSDAKLTPCGLLVTTSYDNSVKIWDSGNGSLVRTLEGHEDGVVCVDVHKNK
jgi:WD40 repeat protein